jgi:peptidylprolyl isomerase
LSESRRRLATVLVASLGLAVIVAVALIASGDDDSGGSSVEVSTDLSSKPEVQIPDGTPPTELESSDVVEGDGETAEPGKQLTVQYVGLDYASGEEFDSSWDSGQPLPFKLGAGDVIQGWDKGIAGMKVGGRRELTIPPDLAYGAQGSPPSISPNATLVFVIDLLDVK